MNTLIVFQPEHDGTLSLESAGGQAVGAASMCWEHVDQAGVFDDQRARLVVDALLAFLRERGQAPDGDALKKIYADAERARRIRAGWNQDDRYGPGVRVDDVSELLHLAWTIIANAGVHQDGWEGLHPEWVQAAIRWRNAYHDTLPRTVMLDPPAASNVETLMREDREGMARYMRATGWPKPGWGPEVEAGPSS